MAANLQRITQRVLSRRKFDAIVIGGGHNGLIAVRTQLVKKIQILGTNICTKCQMLDFVTKQSYWHCCLFIIRMWYCSISIAFALGNLPPKEWAWHSSLGKETSGRRSCCDWGNCSRYLLSHHTFLKIQGYILLILANSFGLLDVTGKAFFTGLLSSAAFKVRILCDVPETSYDLSSFPI